MKDLINDLHFCFNCRKSIFNQLIYVINDTKFCLKCGLNIARLKTLGYDVEIYPEN